MFGDRLQLPGYVPGSLIHSHCFLPEIVTDEFGQGPYHCAGTHTTCRLLRLVLFKRRKYFENFNLAAVSSLVLAIFGCIRFCSLPLFFTAILLVLSLSGFIFVLVSFLCTLLCALASYHYRTLSLFPLSFLWPSVFYLLSSCTPQQNELCHRGQCPSVHNVWPCECFHDLWTHQCETCYGPLSRNTGRCM